MNPRLIFRQAALWAPRGPPVDVLVAGGRVEAISQQPLPKVPGDWEVAARGRLLLPGFVDAHTHLERRLARGLTAGSGFPRGHPQLEEPLRSRFERALTHADLQAAARLALAEAALNGTTGIFALCRAPACAEGSLDQLASAADALGLRAVLAYGASDRDGALAVGVAEGVRFCEARQSDDLVRGMAGLAHPDEVGGPALDAMGELVGRHGLHFHAVETEADLGQGFHLFRERLIDRLAGQGLLGPRTLAAHLNHVSRSETITLADAGCTCAFTPRAALYAEERPPRLEAALDAGAHGTLGTDGLASRAAAELGHALALWRRTARPSAQQGFYLMERLAVGGTRLMTRLFGRPGDPLPAFEPGRLQVGDLADLVLLDAYAPPEESPPPAVSAVGGSGRTIAELAVLVGEARAAWTIVGGRVLVREGELLGQDVARLWAAAQARAEQLWKRL